MSSSCHTDNVEFDSSQECWIRAISELGKTLLIIKNTTWYKWDWFDVSFWQWSFKKFLLKEPVAFCSKENMNVARTYFTISTRNIFMNVSYNFRF